MNNLVYLVPLFPLLGFLLNGLFRGQLSKLLIALIGCGSVLLSFAISVGLFLQVKSTGAAIVVDYFPFINVAHFNVEFAFQVDQLSSLFLLIITGVGFLIHVYSTSYMHEEESPHYARYFAYLNLFVFFMLLLVLGANYVIMFIGWEGVGLCSYLLIGFWFKNDNYNYTAKKAFVMNRIGDLGFLLAIFWIFSKLNTVSFADVFSPSYNFRLNQVDLNAITLLLFIGATGKSAQIPLYTWLPDAMAGPTPVSALIHAATMVTAGIYMIARSNVLFSASIFTQNIILFIGMATMLLSASIALKQNDIKKVLAYSTVSQLGYMFIALGVGAYTSAVFHVMTHAFFKALLFLGAGSVIHSMGGEQDMRKMGGLSKHMRITNLTFLVGCLAIAGIPPFSGFFSKDEILSAAYSQNPIIYWLGVAGACMTAFYMFRLYATTFLGNFRGTHEQEHHLHESPSAITIPLIVLAILAFAGGFFNIPASLGGGETLQKFLSPVLTTEKLKPLEEGTEYFVMGVSFAIAAATSIIAWSIFRKRPELGDATGFGKVLANKWYVDELYDAAIVKPLNSFAGFLKNVVEKSGIDGLVNGVGRFVQYSSRQLRLLQSGLVGNYILLMVLSIAVIFVVFWYQIQIVEFLQKIF